MGSFNIESGENALTPRLNIGDEHRGHDPLARTKRERKKKRRKGARFEGVINVFHRVTSLERNDDFSLEIPPFISVYFARLFARLLHKGKPRKLTEIRFSYIANKS